MAPLESRPRRQVYDDEGHTHFITFACNGRRKLLNQNRCKRIVISRLETTRKAYEGTCFGFVIMPEHVHVLIRFREQGLLSLFKQEWKRQSSVALVEHFTKTANPVLEYLTDQESHHQVWIPKQYDFNIYSRPKAIEKLE
ncbi:MAG: transposase [Planctomycetaceae bacterium]